MQLEKPTPPSEFTFLAPVLGAGRGGYPSECESVAPGLCCRSRCHDFGADNHINVFGYLGGESLHSAIREGRIRSQAFFGHSIIAGCYGATLLPLCVWLWSEGRISKLYTLVGMAVSVIMILTSASSTPIMAMGGTILAFGFWPLRRKMRLGTLGDRGDVDPSPPGYAWPGMVSDLRTSILLAATPAIIAISSSISAFATFGTGGYSEPWLTGRGAGTCGIPPMCSSVPAEGSGPPGLDTFCGPLFPIV